MTIEGHISRNTIPTPSSREWGQTFAIMACVCGISHWLYVQRKNLSPLLERYRNQSVSGHASRSHMRPVNEMRFIMTAANVSLEKIKTGEETLNISGSV
jgi:hypothetical protein